MRPAVMLPSGTDTGFGTVVLRGQAFNDGMSGVGN